MVGVLNESEVVEQLETLVPGELRRRFECLIEKRDDEALTDAEYEELLDLTSQMEWLSVKKLQLMIELSKLRHASLDDVAAEFSPLRKHGR